MSDLWLPKHLRPAQKRIAVVFYYSKTMDRILVGFPEEFPPPPGFQKIVCHTAREVEIWSERLRQQERREAEITEEQREAIEGPIRDYARKQLLNLMANARNAVNREFCRRALSYMDDQDNRRRMKRESFMHAEGFEDGK